MPDMKQRILAFLIACMPLPSFAQEVMPAETVAPDDYVRALNGARIRVMYDGVGQEFLFEVQDRDLANLFSYGLPPAEQTLQSSDMMVVIRDDWAEVEAFWAAAGVQEAAAAVRPYVGAGDAAPNVVVSELTAPDGHTIRFYNFTRFALGEEQSERCMARAVIDDTYRGLGNSTFNAFACSRALH